MTTTKTTKKPVNVRRLTAIAMLSAVAFGLQFVEFSIPIVPSFLKFDLSDLPELIASFAFGPFAGVAVAFIKNLIHMPFSSSMYVGELSNFLLGSVFSIVAGFIYQKRKSKKMALISMLVGSFAMAVVSLPVNYFLVYPLYYSVLGFPQDAVLGMYQVILPSVKSIFQALIIFNVPFTLIKGIACGIITFLIYKPLSPLLHGKRN